MSFNSVRLAPAHTRLHRSVLPRGLLAVWVAGQLVAFGRWAALSHTVGATCDGTVYQSLAAVPTMLTDVATLGILAAVGFPAIGLVLDDARRRDTARIVSAALTWAVLLLVPAAFALVFLGPSVAAWLVHDLSCPGAADLAAAALPWAAPQLPLLGLAGVLGAALGAQGRHGAVAGGAASFGVALATTYLLAAGDDGLVADVIARGTTGGAALLLLVFALFAHRARLVARPTLRGPATFSARVRPLALVTVLVIGCQSFAAVGVVMATSRAGVGVLMVFTDVLAVALTLAAVVVVTAVTRALPGLADVARGLAGVQEPALPRTSRRERLDSRPGLLAFVARRVAALGTVCAGALAAMALPLGGTVAALDAGRGSPAVQEALDALPVAAWALAAALIGLSVAAVLVAALQLRGRTYVAGGAVGGGWLIAGATMLALVMPQTTPVLALLTVGLSVTMGTALSALELAAATTRAEGRGALGGLGRTLAVGAAAAALAGLAGVWVAGIWPVTGLLPYAVQALVLGVGGAALVAVAVLPLTRARRPQPRHAARSSA